MKNLFLNTSTIKILILTIFQSVFNSSFAQFTFERAYGGNNYEEANAVVQASDGGFIVVGYTETFGAGSRDIYVVRTEPDGDTVWTKTFGGIQFDVGHDIIKTDDTHFLIGAYTTSFGIGEGDIYLIKIDENGDILWTKTIGTEANDHIKKIRKTSDDGFIICGDIEDLGQYKFYLVKTNSEGDTLWTKAYDYGIANSIIQTNDQGYAVIIYAYETTHQRYDFQLVKTNQNGDILWSKFYGGPDPDLEIGFALEQTSDQGYLLAGRVNGYGAGGSDFLILKTNSNGDSLWSKTFGGTSDERAFTLVKTSDNGFLIGGYTSTFGGGFFDYYLVKTDGNGDSLWTRTYGGSWQEMVYDIEETDDGGFAVAGYTQTYGAGLFDFYLVKTNQYGLVSDISESVNNKVDNFELNQNFPNPFNPKTVIGYQLPVGGDVTLKVYDLLGREISTLVDEYKPAGRYEIEFNAESLPSGVYFYQLKAVHPGSSSGQAFIETKKMLLLK
jgi:hypothetical protein